MIPDGSPTYESQSNGVAENAVKEAKGLIRTLNAAVDRKLGERLPPGHPLFPFMVEYAGVILSRMRTAKQVSSASGDKKPPYRYVGLQKR